MYSMTGYGEGIFRNILCEIISLNHRFLDIHLSLPDNLLSKEIKIRNLIKKRINRGKIILKIFIQKKEYEFDVEQAKTFYNFVKEAKNELSLKGNIPLNFLFEFKKEKTPKWIDCKTAINLTIDSLIKSKAEEGEKIKKELDFHIHRVEKLIEEIENISQPIESKIQQIKNKLASFGINNGSQLNDMITSIILKEDFSEEKLRLRSHTTKFNDILNTTQNGCIGKYLGFLLQEMMRETNTISAKAKDAKISQLVVEIKNEIEILREQVENVE